MLWACHDCLGFYLLFTRSHCPSPFSLLCQAKDRQRELCVMTAALLQVDSPYLINTNCICLTEIVSLYLIIFLLPAFVKGNHRKKYENTRIDKGILSLDDIYTSYVKIHFYIFHTQGKIQKKKKNPINNLKKNTHSIRKAVKSYHEVWQQFTLKVMQWTEGLFLFCFDLITTSKVSDNYFSSLTATILPCSPLHWSKAPLSLFYRH